MARRTLSLVALGALLLGCSDEALPAGPLLSDQACNALQAEFNATLDSDSGQLGALDDRMERGGCYATDEVRGRMLERDGAVQD